MARVDFEMALYDVLEALKPRFPDIAGAFSRNTSGVDLPYVLSILAVPTDVGREEVARLTHVIDRDRYTAAACVNAVEFVLHTRRWLREAGRGSYAYDDERYQQEFGLAFDEIMEALAPMRAVARDKRDCTTDSDKVKAARVDGAERFSLLSHAEAGGVEVPSGWKLVPVEPTREMVEAWNDSIGDPDVFATWSAMLSASPAAVAGGGE